MMSVAERVETLAQQPAALAWQRANFRKPTVEIELLLVQQIKAFVSALAKKPCFDFRRIEGLSAI